LARLLRRPAGWKPIGRKRLPLVLLVEAGLLGMVIAASSVITSAPPPRGPEFLPPAQIAKPPSTLALPVDDMLINLTIKPNKPGLNLITIDAFNQRRPAPAETLRVQLRLTYLGQNLGTQTVIAELEDGERYRLSTGALSFGGPWDIQVVVRRKGMEDTVADFDWQVESLAPNVQPRAVLISTAPIEPVLSLLAVLLIAVTGVGIFTVKRNARATKSHSQKISSGNPLLLAARHDI
jgi:hypothetical protein